MYSSLNVISWHIEKDESFQVKWNMKIFIFLLNVGFEGMTYHVHILYEKFEVN